MRTIPQRHWVRRFEATLTSVSGISEVDAKAIALDLWSREWYLRPEDIAQIYASVVGRGATFVVSPAPHDVVPPG